MPDFGNKSQMGNFYSVLMARKTFSNFYTPNLDKYLLNSKLDIFFIIKVYSFLI